MEDPFLQLKDDIDVSLNAAISYHDRFLALCQKPCESVLPEPNVTHQEKEWISTELRNILRSVEWDIDDLQQTDFLIAEAINLPRKTTDATKSLLSASDPACRRRFLLNTKTTIKKIREDMSAYDARFRTSSPSIPHCRAENTTPHSPKARNQGNYKYSRLEDADDAHSNDELGDILSKQRLIMKAQDDNLDRVGGSVHVLKDMSQKISSELDEQSIMIDDLTHETGRTHSKLDVVMKKLTKVTHMSDDKRQWQVIIALTVILVFILILSFL